jgi:hypothetical protein
MSIADKLETMETLWEDLSRHAGDIVVPDWHYAVLADREAAVREGTESFIDWEAAKDQLRNSVK